MYLCIDKVVSVTRRLYAFFSPLVLLACFYHPLFAQDNYEIQQQQQILAVTDLNVSPKWEITFVGIRPTSATDHLIVKGILGRRFDWTHHR